MRISELFEKLDLSTAKKYRKLWDPKNYEEIFKKHTDDPKAFRIYLPLVEIKEKPVLGPKSIQDHLKKLDYKVVDYAAGIAKKIGDEKRIIKIGKLLADVPDLKKKFDNDPKRQAIKQENLMVVISRHPYDVAGMSTDRGWSSCMNLVDGEFKKYVRQDVQRGTLVAYLISKNDKNINKPKARISIKPFINQHTKEFILWPGPVYGTATKSFEKTVEDWCEEVSSGSSEGLYCMKSGLYRDAVTTVIRGDLFKMIEKDPKKIKDIEDPSEALQLFAVRQTGLVLGLIKNPSIKVKIAALKSDGRTIKYIDNPTEKMIVLALKTYPKYIIDLETPSETMQMAAVKADPTVIQYIKNPSEAVCIAAIRAEPSIIFRDIKKPTDSMKIAYLEEEPWGIENFKNPSEEMQMVAVKADPETIQIIKNPTEAVQLEAVRKSGWAIEDIKNPTEAVQLEALRSDVGLIDFIKNPTEAVQLYVVQIDPELIFDIKNPTKKVRALARSIGIEI